MVNALGRAEEALPRRWKINRRTLYIHVLVATVMYAKYVVEGILPDNEQTEDEIFHILFAGLIACPEQ